MSFAKTTATKDATKRYNVNSRFLNEAISTQKAGKGRMQARIRSKDHPRVLKRFKINTDTPPSQKGIPVRKRPPVKVKIKKSAAQKIIKIKPGAFVQKFKGITNVWQRQKVGFARKLVKKVKGHKYDDDFNLLRSVSIPQMLGNREGIDELISKSSQKLQERLEHEVNFRLNRLVQRRAGK